MKTLLLILVLLLVRVQAASASCPCPDPPEILIIPADGATEVPLDARIWVTGPLCGDLVRVIVGEAAVDVVTKEGPAKGLFSADPGELLPQTTYEYKLVFSGEGFDGEEEFGPYSFTTGTAAAAAPPTPELSSLTGEYLPDIYDSTIESKGPCFEYLRSQDCHDLGAYGLFSMSDSASSAAVSHYRIQQIEKDGETKDDSRAYSVPGTCGPMVIGGIERGTVGDTFPVPDSTCFQVRAYNLAGVASEAVVVCGDQAEGIDAFDSADVIENVDTAGGTDTSSVSKGSTSSCSFGTVGSAVPLWLLLLLGLGWAVGRCVKPRLQGHR